MKKNKITKKILSGLVSVLLLIAAASTSVLAEGHSATVFLGLGRSTVNIGKTFTLTLKMTPNANASINNFDAAIQFDTTRFDVVMADATNAKVTRPSGVPSTFQLNASVSGGQINILCADETSAMNGPIPTNGRETSLITLTFKVKDNAALGVASFSIASCTINELINLTPTEILLTLVNPTTATVAARLDTNAYLSELKTNIGFLNPSFSKATTQYTLDVPTDCMAATITGKAESSLAKVTVSGGANLAYGANKVTVTVSAQDYDVTRVYTITVNRPSPAVSSSEESSASESSVESSESSSGEESPMESSSLSSSDSSSSGGTAGGSVRFWKTVAYIFILLFFATAGVLVWHIEEKSGRHVKQEKPVKIKRVK